MRRLFLVLVLSLLIPSTARATPGCEDEPPVRRNVDRISVAVAPGTTTICGLDPTELIPIARGREFVAVTNPDLQIAADGARVIGFTTPTPDVEDATHAVSEPYSSLLGQSFLLWADQYPYLGVHPDIPTRTVPTGTTTHRPSMIVDAREQIDWQELFSPNVPPPVVTVQMFREVGTAVTAEREARGCYSLSRPLTAGDWLSPNDRSVVHVTEDATVQSDAPELRLNEERDIYVCRDYGLYHFEPVQPIYEWTRIYEWTVTDASGAFVARGAGPDPYIFGDEDDSPYQPGEVYTVAVQVQNPDGSLSAPTTFVVPFEFNHPWTNPAAVIGGGLLLLFLISVGSVLLLVAPAFSKKKRK